MKKIIILLSVVLSACSGEEQSKNAYGHFEADEIIISPEIPGKIIRYAAIEGKEMMKGDTLAIIDTSQIYLQKQQLYASISTIKAKTLSVSSEIAVLEVNRDYLQSELLRVKKLMEDQAATQMQYDEMKSKEQQVVRQIEALKIKLNNANRGILAEIEPVKARINQLNDQIVKSIITSPISGVILNSYANRSEMAAPGKPLCSISDLSQMDLKVYMTAMQLNTVTVGDKVDISYTASDKVLEGYVAKVSSEAEFTPKNVQTVDEKENLVYAVTVSVTNNGELRIGMPGELILK